MDSPLNSIFELAKERKLLSRAFSTLELNYGDISMRFQFGMSNPDYPAQIRKKIYVLDYDVYTNAFLEWRNIPEYLNRFHEKINESFESVITDGLRAKMGPIDE